MYIECEQNAMGENPQKKTRNNPFGPSKDGKPTVFRYPTVGNKPSDPYKERSYANWDKKKYTGESTNWSRYHGLEKWDQNPQSGPGIKRNQDKENNWGRGILDTKS